MPDHRPVPSNGSRSSSSIIVSRSTRTSSQSMAGAVAKTACASAVGTNRRRLIGFTSASGSPLIVKMYRFPSRRPRVTLPELLLARDLGLTVNDPELLPLPCHPAHAQRRRRVAPSPPMIRSSRREGSRRSSMPKRHSVTHCRTTPKQPGTARERSRRDATLWRDGLASGAEHSDRQPGQEGFTVH